MKFNGVTDTQVLTKDDLALLERHQAELFAMDHAVVSPETRAICESELDAAKRRKWRM